MSKELKKIFPGVKYTVTHRDGKKEDVTVSPVPFGKLPEFGDAVTDLFNKVMEAGTELTPEALFDFGRVFSIAVEEVIGIMCLVLEQERAWFDDITTADGFGLLDVICEQNLNETVKKNILRLVETVKTQFVSTS